MAGKWRAQLRAGDQERGRKKAASNRIACVGFVILSAIGVYLFAPKWWAGYDFQQHAATTEAIVDNAYTQRSHTRKGITFVSYDITYSYSVDGKAYAGHGTIEERPSPKMIVHYDPRTPSISRIDDGGNFRFDCVIFAVLNGVMIAAAIGAWAFTRAIRRMDAARAEPIPERVTA